MIKIKNIHYSITIMCLATSLNSATSPEFSELFSELGGTEHTAVIEADMIAAIRAERRLHGELLLDGVVLELNDPINPDGEHTFVSESLQGLKTVLQDALRAKGSQGGYASRGISAFEYLVGQIHSDPNQIELGVCQLSNALTLSVNYSGTTGTPSIVLSGVSSAASIGNTTIDNMQQVQEIITTLNNLDMEIGR